MANPSPLHKVHEAIDAEWLTVGPAEAIDSGDSRTVQLVATYREIEAEYAAIRKAVGVLDLPNRGTLLVTGSDAVDFLNRMLTNEVSQVVNNQAVRAFLLNRQGRILGDLFLFPSDRCTEATGGTQGAGETESNGTAIYVDVDLFLVPTVLSVLEGYLFDEDVELVDVSNTYHRIVMHGPLSLVSLKRIVTAAEDSLELANGESANVVIGGHFVTVVRRDTVGEVGLELTCPTNVAAEIFDRLLAQGEAAGVRPIGWMAYNMARIEAGTPLIQVDFGTDSLPHETGDLLRDAISFTKGCYPGQEIVARMESRGHPSKILRGIRMTGEWMPTTGAAVYAVVGEQDHAQGGDIVGAVTSAAPSPMLGNIGIAFAMLKYEYGKPGCAVLVGTSEGAIPGEVQALQFWSAS